MLDFTGAACLKDGVKIDAFFSDEDDVYSRSAVGYAKLICRDCPLVDACLKVATENEYLGVWGGLTEIERKRKVRSDAQKKLNRTPGSYFETMAKARNKDRSAIAADQSIPLYIRGLEEQGAGMPEDFRRIIEARISYPDKSLAEIGVLLGISKHAVSGRLRRLKVSVVSGRPLVWIGLNG